MGKNLSIILGAGASHDLISVKVTHVKSQFEPPLAATLFQYRESFADILNKYPRVRALASTIATRVKQGESVEGVLRAVRDSGEQHLVRQFRHVPLYLQELFNRISNEYTDEPTNYTQLMNMVLSSDFDKVAFITLNYDLFLEKSLEGIDGSQPKHIDDYAVLGRKWMLIKLHGSVNWGRPVLSMARVTHNDKIAFAIIDALDLDEEGLLGAVEVTTDRWRKDHLIYPALTVPVEAKYDYACPPSHVQALKEFLVTCGNFLIIGVSGKDQDLLDLLTENVATSGAIAIVGGDNVNDAWVRFHKAVPQFRGTPSRMLPTEHANGFSQFIRSGELGKFLGRLQ